jgi:UDP-N-acetylmuramate dehydrogenase
MPITDDLLADLNVRHEYDVALGPLTWYGVGGRARLMAHPSSVAQLGALALRCRERGVRLYVLGSGANLLVSEAGVDGVVVRLDDPAFAQMKIEGPIVTAGGGVDLFKLVLDTARAGLSGLEVLAGIPATVGGAVRMNAGGAYGDVGACVRRVQVMSDSGQVYYRDRDDLIFSYRKSNIVAPFILEVEFELSKEDPEQIMRRVKEIFLYKKNTQPMNQRSAGCAFKNPQPVAGDGDSDEESSPSVNLPSAGSLIDQAGLKGFRIGGAEVSTVHANFVVTHPGCTADDVLAVMDHVQRTVRERFAIALQREVVVWP